MTARTMYLTTFILITASYQLHRCEAQTFHPLSDKFIELINKEGKWKAGRNFPPDTPMDYIKVLTGAQINLAQYENIPIVEHSQDFIDSLPENFDPREKWPNCPSLSEIRDQGQCGACWAIAPVEAMTDRVCTFFNGTKNFHFSAEDVITCNMGEESCFGGSPITAWNEWVVNGVVSGGNYNSQEGCKPYSFPLCPNYLKKCTHFKSAPLCTYNCRQGYNVSYADDKRRGNRFFLLRGEDHIKAELFKNGPVVTAFLVYEDFISYKSGIYQYVQGKVLAGHAAKMLGWGVENGTKYWLLANSWGTSFGENGYFKFLRGVNECHIENLITAGDPLMEDYL